MENLIVVGTNINPAVQFNAITGEMSISGRLISVSSQEFEFFKPINEWLERYRLNPAPKTKLRIELEFCSSAGIKNLFQLFQVLDDMFNEGKDVSIVWYYHKDDEDSMDKGQNFQRLLSLPIEILKIHQ